MIEQRFSARAVAGKLGEVFYRATGRITLLMDSFLKTRDQIGEESYVKPSEVNLAEIQISDDLQVCAS